MFRRCFVSRVASAVPTKELQLVECPRDAMQGLRDFIATDDKVRYINALLKVGFHTIDFGSFVSAPAVPQMRDTQEVLERLDLSDTKSKLLVVVANVKGAIKATQYKQIEYIGYPLSVSERFQQANTNRNIETALGDIQLVQNLCSKSEGQQQLVTYISMGFGNPYGEDYSVEMVERLVEKVVKMGVRTISLADTVGVSEPKLIRQLFTTLIPRYPEVRFGAHFHSGTTSSSAKVSSAVESGCYRLDGAIGGMGGCPYAKSTLVGNVPTESIVDTLEGMKINHGLNRAELRKCESIKHEIFGVAVKELLLAQTLKNEKSFMGLCMEHFNRWDKNNTGYLEFKEFESCMIHVFGELGAEKPSSDRIEKAFKKLDVAALGVITFEEYMMGARKLLTKKLKEIEAEEVLSGGTSTTGI
jgi:hydroxymethylglutaryl-CoA lyase